MKLFTKEINEKLFKQYTKGSDLDNQKVIAKIFNPYGRGRWFLLNSDPQDPDYIWAIVEMGVGNVEIGSVSRKDLESIRVSPWRFPLERDLSFSPRNAKEIYEGLLQGKHYAEGGELDIAAQNKDMLLNYAEEFEHHTKEFEEAAKNAENVMPWVIAKTERASTDLADVTHYLESENEKRREKIEGEEDDIDDFDRGGEVREFNVLYFKTITNRSGTKMDVMRDRDIISGSLEKVVSKAFDGLTPIDSYANIADRKNSSVVARIYPSGKGEVIQDGYGLNVGEIEIEQEVEEVEEKPKKKLFGLFAEGGEIEDLSDLKGRHFYIYSLGVSVPHVSIIENARITDKKYRHRDVVIESVSGGEERFPLEKLDSFLNGEQIEINDGSEIYVIQLLKDKMAEGGKLDKYNVSFNYNPSNLSNKDAENIVSQYTKNWKHDNDFDDVTFYVMGLSKEDTDMLVKELKMEDVYNIEVDKSNYAKGGMMADGGMIYEPYDILKTFKEETKYEFQKPAQPLYDLPARKELRYAFEIDKPSGRSIWFRTKYFGDWKENIQVAYYKGDNYFTIFQGDNEIKTNDLSVLSNRLKELHSKKVEINKNYYLNEYSTDSSLKRDVDLLFNDKMAEGGMMSNGGSTSSPNAKFMKWFGDWLKSVNKYIYVSISIPNEFSSPIKNGNDEIVILDIIEKKGDADVKKYMNEIVKKADEFGVSIYLQPIPRTHNLKSQEHKDKITKDYLIKYYEKFGFKNMDGGFMVREPKMAEGGVTDPMATANEIARLSGVRTIAITEWADKNNINLYEILKDLKRKKIKGLDLMTAIVGNPNNKYQKELLAKYSRTKMAKGGVVEKKYFMTISFDQKQRSGGYGINRVSVSVRAKNQTEAISKAKKIIREGYRGDMPIKNVEVIYPSIKVEDITYEKGGKITFDDKVSAIKKSLLERKKVSPSVQKDYGKTYSPKEAEESAKRIVGAMTAKERLMKKRKK